MNKPCSTTPYAGPIRAHEFADQFLTIREYARVMNCCERHVRRLAYEMAFSDFGIPMVSIQQGRYRKIYIFSPGSSPRRSVCF